MFYRDIQTLRISSKILRYVSYFQLSSYRDETLSLVFDILHQTRKTVFDHLSIYSIYLTQMFISKCEISPHDVFAAIWRFDDLGLVIAGVIMVTTCS